MKKITAIVLALVALLALTACSAGSSVKEDTRPLTEIMEDLMKNTDTEIHLMESEATADSYQWFFGIDPVEGAETLISEAAISSIPYSVALMRVPEGADAAKIAQDIEDGASDHKWVCVTAERKVVLNSGRLILLVMTDKATADTVEANFTQLYK